MMDQHVDEMTSYLDWSDKGKASFWRYLLGFVLAILILFVLGSVVVMPLSAIKPDYAESPSFSLIGTLLSFLVLFVAIPLIVALLHRRPYWSVAMPVPRIETWNLFTGFWVSAVVGVVVAAALHFAGIMPMEYVGLDWSQLLPVALIGFVAIFIQASSEELLFRGYITQFVRRFTANKLLFIGIPALLFALPHIINITELGGTFLVMVPYLILGLLLAWAAYRTGSLWMAAGLHWSNNFMTIVLIGTRGDVLPSVAPFQVDIPSLSVATMVVAVQSVLMVVVLRYLIGRRETAASL